MKIDRFTAQNSGSFRDKENKGAQIMANLSN
jgi:hypothetical protein